LLGLKNFSFNKHKRCLALLKVLQCLLELAPLLPLLLVVAVALTRSFAW
jgi:hypothetical protein